MKDEQKIPINQIASMSMVIGECCRVESEVFVDGHRILTITCADGVICVFKGAMEFTWLIPPKTT